MDKEKIMMAMDHIDAAFIAEAADGEKATRKYNWRRVAVIAACMCLVLAGTVAAAVGAGVHIEFLGRDEWLSRSEEDANSPVEGGYWATSAVRVPVEEFSDEVQALAEQEERKERTLGFNDWTEMENFVGLEVANNRLLDEATLDGEVEKSESRFSFNDEGQVRGYGILRVRRGLEYIDMSANYTLYDTIRVMVNATVVSEQVAEETDFLAYGSATPYTEDMTMEEYTMSNGQVATIVSTTSVTVDGDLYHMTHTASFQGDNAIISVQTHDLADEFSSLEEYRQKDALTTLKEVLDAFE